MSAMLHNPDRSLPPEFASVSGRIAERLASDGITLAVIYGSRARGEKGPRSDLDIGLLAVGGEPIPYQVMGLLAADLTGLLSHEVDLSDLSTPDAIFRYEVAGCARILFESRSGAFADFVAKTLIDYFDIQRFIPELVAGVSRNAMREVTTQGTST
jgi:predicted nucleotidyltransferase